MAILSGNIADVYICSGTGTTFTDEATTLVSGTTYQITDASKRIIDTTSAITVKDGATTLASTAYTVVPGTGKVILAAAPSGAVTVTGKYLTASQLAQCTKWSANIGPNLQDVSVFGSAWEQKAAVLQKGSITVNRFYATGAYFYTQLNVPMVVTLYENQSGGARYVAVCQMETDALEVSEGAIQGENVSFTTTGNVDYASS